MNDAAFTTHETATLCSLCAILESPAYPEDVEIPEVGKARTNWAIKTGKAAGWIKTLADGRIVRTIR